MQRDRHRRLREEGVEAAIDISVSADGLLATASGARICWVSDRVAAVTAASIKLAARLFNPADQMFRVDRCDVDETESAPELPRHMGGFRPQLMGADFHHP